MIDEILPINEVGFNQAAIRKDDGHAWIPIRLAVIHFVPIVPTRGRENRAVWEHYDWSRGLSCSWLRGNYFAGYECQFVGLEKSASAFVADDGKESFNREDFTW